MVEEKIIFILPIYQSYICHFLPKKHKIKLTRPKLKTVKQKGGDTKPEKKRGNMGRDR